MNNYFDLKRTWILMIRELLLNKKNLLIMLASLILLFLLLDFSLLNDFFVKGYGLKHTQVYPFVVLVYCLIVTSTAFAEMNFTERKIDYLMLPASVVEKFSVKFIYTTVIMLIVCLAALSISALIAELITRIIGSEILFKKIFHSYSIRVLFDFIKAYLACHSIFFLGAVFYKKLEFGKTVLTITVLLTIIGAYLLILNYAPFFKNPLSQKIILQQFGVFESQLSSESQINTLMFFRGVKRDVYFVSVYILPFILWGIAYLRLKEEEVNNGI